MKRLWLKWKMTPPAPQGQDFKCWTFIKGLNISRNHLRSTILYMSIVTKQTASAFPSMWIGVPQSSGYPGSGVTDGLDRPVKSGFESFLCLSLVMAQIKHKNEQWRKTSVFLGYFLPTFLRNRPRRGNPDGSSECYQQCYYCSSFLWQVTQVILFLPLTCQLDLCSSGSCRFSVKIKVVAQW